MGLSVPEKLFQLVAGRIFARVGRRLGNEVPPRQLKIFAKIARRFLQNRVRPPVAALMGRAGVIAEAIQANPQIGVATMT
jgi:hypothetical protein